MPPGKVLIERHPNQDVLRDVGIRASDSGSSGHRFKPNVGKVIAVCASLPFTYDEVLALKEIGAPKRHLQEATRRSVQFLAPIEIKAGDTVVYRYVHNWEEDDDVNEQGSAYGWENYVVIDHDSLICRLNEDGSVYPLAGNVLIEDVRERQSPFTRVLAVGAPLLRDFDHPDEVDADDLVGGETVAINYKHSIPVQDPELGIALESLLGCRNIAFIKRRYIHFIIDARSTQDTH